MMKEPESVALDNAVVVGIAHSNAHFHDHLQNYCFGNTELGSVVECYSVAVEGVVVVGIGNVVAANSRSRPYCCH